MSVLGIQCLKDKLIWAFVEGDGRTTAQLSDCGATALPADERSKQLLWVYKEFLEILASHPCSIVSLSEAETGQSVRNATLERAQMDGVVLAAAAQFGTPVQRLKWATTRARFGVGGKREILAHVAQMPLAKGLPQNRLVPVTAALAVLGE